VAASNGHSYAPLTEFWSSADHTSLVITTSNG